MKCHYIYDKEAGKVHIPGCWSAVHHGPSRCICRVPKPPDPRDELIKELEKENARLNRVIKNLLKRRVNQTV